MALEASRGGIERVYRGATVSGLTERELLDRFVQRRDSLAFEALVHRHGPMVLGVCRRLLRDPNDVDDAFQATFLVLVRKADTLRRRDLLGNWLYGVALKVASRSRVVAASRRDPEGLESLPAPNEPKEVDAAVAEEVQWLPEKYRSPVVLCYLEGLTHEEAADRLGWPLGTVKGRLSRARDLLRSRLTRRGVTLAVAATAVEAVARPLGGAVVAEQLLASAIKATTSGAKAGVVPAKVLALTEGVLHAMSLTKLKTVAATLIVSGALVSGGGAMAYQGFSPPGPADKADSRTRGALLAAMPGEALSRAAAQKPATPDPDPFDDGKVKPGQASDGAGAEAAVDETSVRERIVARSAQLARIDTAAADKAILDKLKTPVAVKFANPTPLADVLKYLKAALQTPNDSGIPIYVDPLGLQEAEKTITSTVTIDLDGVPLRTTLPLMLDQLGLTYTVENGLLVISSTKGIGRFSNTAASLVVREKLLARLVGFNFANETPFEDVLKYIKSVTQGTNDTGIPMYVDPLGLQEAEQTLASPIIIDLEDVPLRTCLRLVLRQLGLAYCVRDGVLIISTEDRVLEELDEALAEIEAARP